MKESRGYKSTYHPFALYIDLLDNLFDPNTPGTRHRSGTNNNGNGSGSNSALSANANTNGNNGSQQLSSASGNDAYTTSTSSTHVSSDKLRSETENAKDPYLVDVDVDVDGVMMDGLDQVEYMNRGVGNSAGTRFYVDGEDGVLDDEIEYAGEQGARFTPEPISRMLEALALEGLTEF